MAGPPGSPGSACRLGAVGGSGSLLLLPLVLLLLLRQGLLLRDICDNKVVGQNQTDSRRSRDLVASTEIPAGSIDPAAIDLAPLVNTLIDSTQSGPLQLFSLLSVTSYSSLELHKLTLLIYNISSLSVESKMFQRRFCYCVNNKTNDLTDFTAVLLDVMSNSSYLHEIFKSTSILSVSQQNDTDCIYICVMAGQTDRDLPQLWESALITPLFNQTILEDPHRSGNLSLQHSSMAWQQLPPRPSQTSQSRPGVHLGGDSAPTLPSPSVLPHSLTTSTTSSTRTTSTTSTTRTPSTTRTTSTLSTTSTPTTTSTTKTNSITSITAHRPAEPTADPLTSVALTTSTPPTPEQRGITTPVSEPPTPATVPPITTERATLALPLVTSSTTAQKTTVTNGKTTDTQQEQSGVQPQEATPHPAHTVLVGQQEVTSSLTGTSVVYLLPVGLPVDSTAAPTVALASEKPGCPWTRVSGALSSVSEYHEGPWTALGPHKLQPCLLELCKFFSQCVCRPNRPRTPQRRYCEDSHQWYRKHTPELCSRLKRTSFSRNLKQRCLAKMCGRP